MRATAPGLYRSIMPFDMSVKTVGVPGLSRREAPLSFDAGDLEIEEGFFIVDQTGSSDGEYAARLQADYGWQKILEKYPETFHLLDELDSPESE